MTNTNKWAAPKNINKPVETVCELKENEYKVPSFEEFMETYNEKEGVSDSYQSEFDSYGDLRVKGTYYGPGFWDDFLKPVSKGVLIVASVFPPTAPIAAPITATVATVGLVAKGVGHITDDEGVKKFGDDLVDIASDTISAQGGEVEFVNKFRK